MSCRLKNINDDKLIDLKERFGDKQGLNKWYKIYGHLQSTFTSESPIDTNSVKSMQSKLDAYNEDTGENHSLIINDGSKEFKYGDIQLTQNGKYTVDIDVDWGDTVVPSTAYSINVAQPLFDDDGDMIMPDDDLMKPHVNFMNEKIMDPDDEAMEREAAMLRAERSGDVIDISILKESEDALRAEMESLEDAKDSISQVLILTGRKIIDIKSRTGKLIANLDDIESQISKLRVSGASRDAISELENRAKIIIDKIDFNKESLESLYHRFLVAKKSRNIEQLQALFYDHYEFAVKLANSENADEGDLVLAISALNMWSRIKDIATAGNVHTSKEVREKLNQIQKKANDSSIDDLKEAAKELLIKYGEETGVKVGGEDFETVEDVGSYAANLRTIGETKIKLLNLLDRFLKNAHLRVTGELFDVRKTIRKMFSDLHKNGLSVNMFFEKNENGKVRPKIIGRLNSIYHEELKKINDGFNSAIERADEDRVQESRTAKKAKAINTRNAALLERNYIINPIDLYDAEKHAKIKRDLIDITGSDTYAEEKINEALNKYQQYVEDRSNKRFSLIGEGKDLDEVDKRILKYGLSRDPSVVVEYMNKKDVGEDIRNIEWGERYLVMVPRRIMNNKKGTSTNYYNQDFQDTILNNPKAFEFYNKYLNIIEKLLSYLPYYITNDLPENFYPSMEKDFWSKAVSAGGKFGVFSGIKRGVIDALSTSRAKIMPTTDITGSPIRKVPIKMINDVSEEERSLDMENVLYAFAESAISYKYMSQVEDKATLVMQMLRDVKAVTVNPDGTLMRDKTGVQKKQLENAIKIGQYAIDNNIYGIRYSDEGVTSKKFFNSDRQSIMLVDQDNYDTRILEEYYKLTRSMSVPDANNEIMRMFPNKVALVTEKEANRALTNKLRDLEDKKYFGQIDDAKFKAQTERIRNVAGLLGQSFSWAKLADKVVNFGYYKSFSWNIFPAFANKAFGDIAIMNHAAGGRDFNTKDAIWAINQALVSSISSINSGSLNSNKLYNLCHRFGIVSDIVDSVKMRKNVNLGLLTNPMAMMSNADYQIRSATMAAMMKGKEMIDINGKKRTLYDAFNDDGTWNVSEFGEDEKWNGNPNEFTDNTELFKFINKIRGVNMMLHGNMDSDTSIMAKSTVLGRLLGQYRVSWMVPGFNARFESKRYDSNLERYVEGRFISTGRFVMNNGVFGTMDTLLKLMMLQGSKAFDGKNMSAEDRDMIVENVKKTFHEIMVWGMMYGAYLLMSASMDDKDSDDAKFKYAALNQLNRLMGDISFYFSPNTFENILNNVVPSMSVLTDFLRFSRSLVKYYEGDEYYDAERVFLNVTRQLPLFNMVNKLEYQTRQILQQNQ